MCVCWVVGGGVGGWWWWYPSPESHLTELNLRNEYCSSEQFFVVAQSHISLITNLNKHSAPSIAMCDSQLTAKPPQHFTDQTTH